LAAVAFRRLCRLALALCTLGLVVACSAAPQERLPLGAGRAAPPRLEGVQGPLSEAQSKAILDRLLAEASNADVLRRHLAFEEAITDTPITVGNRTKILRDGEASFAAVFDLIRISRHHLNLEYFIFEDVELNGRSIVDLLIEKRRRGVAVNLIYDSLGSSRTPDEVFERLRKAGVRLLAFNTPVVGGAPAAYSPANRDHRKMLIADGKVAITGGLNLSKVYSSNVLSSGGKSENSDRWRDTSVRVEGPAVTDFQRLFLATWQSQKGEPLPEAGFFPRARAAGDTAIRVIGSDPARAAPLFYVTLLSAMQHAESRLWLTTGYFVPQREQVDALEAAARRGVDVRLLLPSRSDWAIAMDAGRSHYEDLLEAGVKIFELNDAVLHSKTAVIDGVWSAIGSSNIDSLSAGFNAEVDIVALGAAPGGEMEAMFNDDLRNATEITTETWRQRGIDQRLRELFARAWAYWL
jgi:cardiolipin synthase